jgi:hypothetical protein
MLNLLKIVFFKDYLKKLNELNNTKLLNQTLDEIFTNINNIYNITDPNIDDLSYLNINESNNIKKEIIYDNNIKIKYNEEMKKLKILLQ